MTGFIPSNAILLSELEVDTDKDWKGYGITNIKELTSGMAQGAIVHRGTTVLENLPAGTADQFLQTRGSARSLWWRSL